MKLIVFAILSLTCLLFLSPLPSESSLAAAHNQTGSTAQSDDTAIQDYGQKVLVKGKYMNTYTVGDASRPTIVWTPGLGEFSPVLSYTNLTNELAKTYQVVIIEPFGTGLSDTIGTPRTIANISEEIHEAVSQLGLKEYYLMGHSISGLYSMQYVNDYKDEVLGYLGIDTTAPQQFAELDVFNEPLEEEDIPTIPDVSQEINDQYVLIAKSLLNNPDTADEEQRVHENSKAAMNYSFPKDMPVYFMLAKDPAFEGQDNFIYYNDTLYDWKQIHEELIRDVAIGKVEEFTGPHTLYHTAYKELAAAIESFIESLPSQTQA